MSKIDHIFSVAMTLFGFFVMCTANAAIYAPYDVVGYLITAGFVISLTGVYHFSVDKEK